MPTSNPMISAGTLNRLRGSVNLASLPALNVTAPYLGKAGITLQLEGDSTTMIPAMAGVVTSPEPYMMATVVINLLKTQGLAGQYKARMENSSLIGDIIITPDATTLPTYTVTNAAIESVKEMSFNGEDASFAVTLKGTYYINNAQWGL